MLSFGYTATGWLGSGSSGCASDQVDVPDRVPSQPPHHRCMQHSWGELEGSPPSKPHRLSRNGAGSRPSHCFPCCLLSPLPFSPAGLEKLTTTCRERRGFPPSARTLQAGPEPKRQLDGGVGETNRDLDISYRDPECLRQIFLTLLEVDEEFYALDTNGSDGRRKKKRPSMSASSLEKESSSHQSCLPTGSTRDRDKKGEGGGEEKSRDKKAHWYYGTNAAVRGVDPITDVNSRTSSSSRLYALQKFLFFLYYPPPSTSTTRLSPSLSRRSALGRLQADLRQFLCSSTSPCVSPLLHRMSTPASSPPLAPPSRLLLTMIGSPYLNSACIDSEILVDVDRREVALSSLPGFGKCQVFATKRTPIQATLLRIPPCGKEVPLSQRLHSFRRSCLFPLSSRTSCGVSAVRPAGTGKTASGEKSAVIVLQRSHDWSHGGVQFFVGRDGEEWPSGSPFRCGPDVGGVFVPTPFSPRRVWGVCTAGRDRSWGAIVAAYQPRILSDLSQFSSSNTVSSRSTFRRHEGRHIAFSVTTNEQGTGDLSPRPLLFKCCRCCCFGTGPAAGKTSSALSATSSSFLSTSSSSGSRPTVAQGAAVECSMADSRVSDPQLLDLSGKGGQLSSLERYDEEEEEEATCGFPDAAQASRGSYGWTTVIPVPPLPPGVACPSPCASRSSPGKPGLRTSQEDLFEVLWVSDIPGLPLCLVHSPSTRRYLLCFLHSVLSSTSCSEIRSYRWSLEQEWVRSPHLRKDILHLPTHARLAVQLAYSAPSLEAIQIHSFPASSPSSPSARLRGESLSVCDKSAATGRRGPCSFFPSFSPASDPLLKGKNDAIVVEEEAMREERDWTGGGEVDGESPSLFRRGWDTCHKIQLICLPVCSSGGGRVSSHASSSPSDKGKRKGPPFPPQSKLYERLRLALLDEENFCLSLVPVFPNLDLSKSPSHLKRRDIRVVENVISFVALSPNSGSMAGDSLPLQAASMETHRLAEGGEASSWVNVRLLLPAGECGGPPQDDAGRRLLVQTARGKNGMREGHAPRGDYDVVKNNRLAEKADPLTAAAAATSNASRKWRKEDAGEGMGTVESSDSCTMPSTEDEEEVSRHSISEILTLGLNVSAMPQYLVVLHQGGSLGLYAGPQLLTLLSLNAGSPTSSSFCLKSLNNEDQISSERKCRDSTDAARSEASDCSMNGGWGKGVLCGGGEGPGTPVRERETKGYLGTERGLLCREGFRARQQTTKNLTDAKRDEGGGDAVIVVALSQPVSNRLNITLLQAESLLPPSSSPFHRKKSLHTPPVLHASSPSSSLASPPPPPPPSSCFSIGSVLKTFRCSVQLSPSDFLLRCCTEALLALLPPTGASRVLKALFQWCLNPVGHAEALREKHLRSSRHPGRQPRLSKPQETARSAAFSSPLDGVYRHRQPPPQHSPSSFAASSLSVSSPSSPSELEWRAFCSLLLSEVVHCPCKCASECFLEQPLSCQERPHADCPSLRPVSPAPAHCQRDKEDSVAAPPPLQQPSVETLHCTEESGARKEASAPSGQLDSQAQLAFARQRTWAHSEETKTSDDIAKTVSQAYRAVTGLEEDYLQIADVLPGRRKNTRGRCGASSAGGRSRSDRTRVEPSSHAIGISRGAVEDGGVPSPLGRQEVFGFSQERRQSIRDTGTTTKGRRAPSTSPTTGAHDDDGEGREDGLYAPSGKRRKSDNGTRSSSSSAVVKEEKEETRDRARSAIRASSPSVSSLEQALPRCTPRLQGENNARTSSSSYSKSVGMMAAKTLSERRNSSAQRQVPQQRGRKTAEAFEEEEEGGSAERTHSGELPPHLEEGREDELACRLYPSSTFFAPPYATSSPAHFNRQRAILETLRRLGWLRFPDKGDEATRKGGRGRRGAGGGGEEKSKKENEEDEEFLRKSRVEKGEVEKDKKPSSLEPFRQVLMQEFSSDPLLSSFVSDVLDFSTDTDDDREEEKDGVEEKNGDDKRLAEEHSDKPDGSGAVGELATHPASLLRPPSPRLSLSVEGQEAAMMPPSCLSSSSPPSASVNFFQSRISQVGKTDSSSPCLQPCAGTPRSFASSVPSVCLSGDQVPSDSSPPPSPPPCFSTACRPGLCSRSGRPLYGLHGYIPQIFLILHALLQDLLLRSHAETACKPLGELLLELSSSPGFCLPQFAEYYRTIGVVLPHTKTTSAPPSPATSAVTEPYQSFMEPTQQYTESIQERGEESEDSMAPHLLDHQAEESLHENQRLWLEMQAWPAAPSILDCIEDTWCFFLEERPRKTSSISASSDLPRYSQFANGHLGGVSLARASSLRTEEEDARGIGREPGSNSRSMKSSTCLSSHLPTTSVSTSSLPLPCSFQRAECSTPQEALSEIVSSKPGDIVFLSSEKRGEGDSRRGNYHGTPHSNYVGTAFSLDREAKSKKPPRAAARLTPGSCTESQSSCRDPQGSACVVRTQGTTTLLKAALARLEKRRSRSDRFDRLVGEAGMDRKKEEKKGGVVIEGSSLSGGRGRREGLVRHDATLDGSVEEEMEEEDRERKISLLSGQLLAGQIGGKTAASSFSSLRQRGDGKKERRRTTRHSRSGYAVFSSSASSSSSSAGPCRSLHSSFSYAFSNCSVERSGESGGLLRPQQEGEGAAGGTLLTSSRRKDMGKSCRSCRRRMLCILHRQTPQRHFPLSRMVLDFFSLLHRAMRRRRRRRRSHRLGESRRKEGSRYALRKSDLTSMLEKLVSVYGLDRQLLQALVLPLQLPLREVFSLFKEMAGGDLVEIFTEFLRLSITRKVFSSSSSYSRLLRDPHEEQGDITETFVEACLLLDRPDIAMNGLVTLPSIATSAILLWSCNARSREGEGILPTSPTSKNDHSSPSSLTAIAQPTSTHRSASAGGGAYYHPPCTSLSYLVAEAFVIADPALRVGGRRSGFCCLSSSIPVSTVLAPREFVVMQKGGELEDFPSPSASSRLGPRKNKNKKSTNEQGERSFLSRWGGIAPNVREWIRGIHSDSRLDPIALALDPTALRRIEVVLSSEAVSSLSNTATASLTNAALGEDHPHGLFDETDTEEGAIISGTGTTAFMMSSSRVNLSLASPSLPGASSRMSTDRTRDGEGDERPSYASSTSSVPLLQKLPPLDSALAYAARDRGIALQQGLSVGRGALMLGSLLGEDGGERGGEGEGSFCERRRTRGLQGEEGNVSFLLTLLDIPPIEMRVLLVPKAVIPTPSGSSMDRGGVDESPNEEEISGGESTPTAARDSRRRRRIVQMSVCDETEEDEEEEEAGERRADFALGSRASPRRGHHGGSFDLPSFFLSQFASLRASHSFHLPGSVHSSSPAFYPFLATLPLIPPRASNASSSSSTTLSWYILPSQIISRDTQRQPTEQDAWAQFHNACAAALALPPAASPSPPDCLPSSLRTSCGVSSRFFVAPLLPRNLHVRRAGHSSADQSFLPFQKPRESREKEEATERGTAGRVRRVSFHNADRKYVRHSSSSPPRLHLLPPPLPSASALKQRDHKAFAEFLQIHGEAYAPHEFGGFLLGLGLRGYFYKYNAYDGESTWLRLLWEAFDQETVQTGLILGLTSSFAGTRLKSLEQLCLAHLPYSLRDSFVEVEMKSAPQCAGLLGLGLLFSCSSSQYISRLLLYHLLRPPCLLSDKQHLDRDAYALSAAWAIGTLWSGHCVSHPKKTSRDNSYKKSAQERRRKESHEDSDDSRGRARGRHREEEEERDQEDSHFHAAARKAQFSSSEEPKKREGRSSSSFSSCSRKSKLSVFWREIVTIANINTSRPWGSLRRDFFQPPSHEALDPIPTGKKKTASRRPGEEDEDGQRQRRRRSPNNCRFLFQPPCEDFYKKRHVAAKKGRERHVAFSSLLKSSFSSSSSLTSPPPESASMIPTLKSSRCLLQQEWLPSIKGRPRNACRKASTPPTVTAMQRGGEDCGRETGRGGGGGEEYEGEQRPSEGEGGDFAGGERRPYPRHERRPRAETSGEAAGADRPSSCASLYGGIDGELMLLLLAQGNHSGSGGQRASSLSSSSYRSNLHWGCLNASEISGPAAIAVGLAFLDSDNEEAREGLRIPADLDQLIDVLPQVLMCKVLARALIGWSSIVPSHRWIAAQLPPVLRLLPTDFLDGSEKIPDSAPPPPFVRVVDFQTRRILPPHPSGSRRSSRQDRKEKEEQSHRDKSLDSSSSRTRSRRHNCSRSVLLQTEGEEHCPRRPEERRRGTRQMSRSRGSRKGNARWHGPRLWEPMEDSGDVGSAAIGDERGHRRDKGGGGDSRRAVSRGDPSSRQSMQGIGAAIRHGPAIVDVSRTLREGNEEEGHAFPTGREREEVETRRKNSNCTSFQEERSSMPRTQPLYFATTPPERGGDMTVEQRETHLHREEAEVDMERTMMSEREDEKRRKETKTTRENAKRGSGGDGSTSGFPFSPSAGKYRIHALGGALWALGLRYAGTNNRRCVHLLLRYMHYLRRGQCGRSASSPSRHASPLGAPAHSGAKRMSPGKHKKTRTDEEVSRLHTGWVDIDERTEGSGNLGSRSTSRHGSAPLLQAQPSSSSGNPHAGHRLPMSDPPEAEREEEMQEEEEEGRVSEAAHCRRPSSSSTSTGICSPPDTPPPLSLCSLSSSACSLLQSIFTTLSLFSLPLPPSALPAAGRMVAPEVETTTAGGGVRGEEGGAERQASRTPVFASSSLFREEDLILLKYASINTEEEEALDVCALTCCLSLALVSAGTCSPEVIKTLFYERHLRISRPHPETSIASTALTGAVISQLGGGGEGYEQATALAQATAKCKQQPQYGALMLLHQALGIVCMGGGRSSFRESFGRVNPLDISVLLLSLYPLKPPTNACDQRSHLQASRHLWVLAAESRALIPLDVDTGQRVPNLPATLLTLSSSRNNGATTEKLTRKIRKSAITLPSLLPSPQRLLQLRIDHDGYWPIVLRGHRDSDSYRSRFEAAGAASESFFPADSPYDTPSQHSSSSSLATYFSKSIKCFKEGRYVLGDRKENERPDDSPCTSSIPFGTADGVLVNLNVFSNLLLSRGGSGAGGFLFVKRRGLLHFSDGWHTSLSPCECVGSGGNKDRLRIVFSSSKTQNSSSSSSCLPESSLSLFRFCLPSKQSRPDYHPHHEEFPREVASVCRSEQSAAGYDRRRTRILAELLAQQHDFDASCHGYPYALARLARCLLKLSRKILLHCDSNPYTDGVAGREAGGRRGPSPSMQLEDDLFLHEGEGGVARKKVEVLQLRLEMLEKKLQHAHAVLRAEGMREDCKRSDARLFASAQPGVFNASLSPPSPPLSSPSLSQSFLLGDRHRYGRPQATRHDRAPRPRSFRSASAASRPSSRLRPDPPLSVHRRGITAAGLAEDGEKEKKEGEGEREEELSLVPVPYGDGSGLFSSHRLWVEELILLAGELYDLMNALVMWTSGQWSEGQEPSASAMEAFSSCLRAVELRRLGEREERKREEEEEHFVFQRVLSLKTRNGCGPPDGDFSSLFLHAHPKEIAALRFLHRFFKYMGKSCLSVPSYLLHTFPSSTAIAPTTTPSSVSSSVLSPVISDGLLVSRTHVDTDPLYEAGTGIFSKEGEAFETEDRIESSAHLSSSSSSSVPTNRMKSLSLSECHQRSELSVLRPSTRNHEARRSQFFFSALPSPPFTFSRVTAKIWSEHTALPQGRSARRQYRRLYETAIVTYAVSGLLGSGMLLSRGDYGGAGGGFRTGKTLFSSLAQASPGGSTGGIVTCVGWKEWRDEEERAECRALASETGREGRAVSQGTPAGGDRGQACCEEDIEMKNADEDETSCTDAGEEDCGEKTVKSGLAPIYGDLGKVERWLCDSGDNGDAEGRGEVYTQFISFMVLHDLPLVSTWKAFCRERLLLPGFVSRVSPSSPTCSRDQTSRERALVSFKPFEDAASSAYKQHEEISSVTTGARTTAMTERREEEEDLLTARPEVTKAKPSSSLSAFASFSAPSSLSGLRISRPVRVESCSLVPPHTGRGEIARSLRPFGSHRGVPDTLRASSWEKYLRFAKEAAPRASPEGHYVLGEALHQMERFLTTHGQAQSRSFDIERAGGFFFTENCR